MFDIIRASNWSGEWNFESNIISRKDSSDAQAFGEWAGLQSDEQIGEKSKSRQSGSLTVPLATDLKNDATMIGMGQKTEDEKIRVAEDERLAEDISEKDFDVAEVTSHFALVSQLK